MEAKRITCINCPMGCSLEINKYGDNYNITGNSCKRGIDYGISEVTNPMRGITTSIFVSDGVHPTVSVKTTSDIPKGLIFKAVRELAGITINAPVKIGDIIIKNVLNTGADFAATRNVDKKAAE